MMYSYLLSQGSKLIGSGREKETQRLKCLREGKPNRSSLYLTLIIPLLQEKTGKDDTIRKSRPSEDDGNDEHTTAAAFLPGR